MMAGRVPYGERYWQTPLKQTAPLGPQDVKFGSVACCTQPLSRTHVEAVQGLVSAQFGGGPPTQTPRMQESPVVHRLPSSHEAPVGRATCWQPSVGSQLSVVQEFLSSQSRGGPLTH